MLSEFVKLNFISSYKNFLFLVISSSKISKFGINDLAKLDNDEEHST